MGIETDKEVQENIVAGLKKLRKERGLSQRVFLYDTGIHIGRIETGASPITITTLNRICSYYEITIKDFFIKYY